MNKNDLRAKIEIRVLKSEIIHIDDWESDVQMCELTGEKLMFISELSMKNGKVDEKTFYNYAIIECLYTTPEDGDEKVYSAKDFDEVKDLPGLIYSQLVQTIMRLHGLTGESNPKN